MRLGSVPTLSLLALSPVIRSISLGLAGLVGCVVLGAFSIAWLNRKPPEEKKTELVLPVKRKAPEIAKPAIPFENITASSGIDWQHFNAMEGEKLLPETMGGGVSILDFDNDGDQDILFVGGESWSWSRSIELWQLMGVGRATRCRGRSGRATIRRSDVRRGRRRTYRARHHRDRSRWTV